MKKNLKIYKLKNGLEILILKSRVKKLHAFLWIEAGPLYEKKGVNGVSHLIEHLILPASEEKNGVRTKEIDKLNGEIVLSIDKEFVYLNSQFNNQSLEKSVGFLKELVFDLDFNKKEIEREKKIIIEEIGREKDDIISALFDLTAQTRFSGPCGYSLPMLGTKKSLKKIRKKEIKKFYNKYYSPSNITIGIASNLDIDQVFEKTEKILKDIKRKKKPKTPIPTYSNFKINIKDFFNSKRVYLGINFPATNASGNLKNRLIEILISHYLAEFQSSVLIQKLRARKNLIHDIWTYRMFTKKAGVFNIFTDFNKKNTNTVLSTILKEIGKIKQGKINKKLFIYIKKRLNKYTKEQFSNWEDKFDWLMEDTARYQKKIISPKRVIETRNSISEKDLQKRANKVFNYKKMNIVGLGKVKEKEIQDVLDKKIDT